MPRCVVLCRASIAAAGLLGFASMSIAQAWFAGLGRLQGGTQSNALGISADGQVVVGAADVNGVQLPVRWTLGGGLSSIGALPGTSFSLAKRASDDGSVIVGQSNGRAFRWTSSGGTVDLGAFAPDNGGFSSAWGVSDDGETVIGTAAAGDNFNAFRWTATSNTLENMGFFDGSALSGDGHSFAATLFTQNGSLEAYRSDGLNAQQIGPLPGFASFTQPRALSFDGSIAVGYGRVNDGLVIVHDSAFIWRQDSGILALADLAGGGLDSDAYDLTDDGSLIVGQGTTAQGKRAAVWVNGAVQSAQSFLASQGVTGFTGWTLTNASAVSSDGLTLAGQGFNPQGQFEGWVAHIPAPGTSGMFSVFVTSFARRQRRHQNTCFGSNR